MKTKNTCRPNALISQQRLFRIAIFIALVMVVVVPSFMVSSATSPVNRVGANSEKNVQRAPKMVAAPVMRGLAAGLKRLPLLSALTLAPQSSSPAIATYNSGCTEQATEFVLGTEVCARVTGGTTFPRRVTFVDPSGFIRQITNVTADPEDITFQIPTTETSVVGNDTVDNRGTWRVNMISSRGSVVTSTQFLVTDPAQPVSDLSINKQTSTADDSVSAGSSSSFQIYVQNYGPDSALNVVLTDVVPPNTTFVAMVQTNGPTFTCTTPLPGSTGTVSCTRSSLARGDSATFDFAYTVDVGTATGTVITNTATISSDTAEVNASDNSSSAQVRVTTSGGGGGGATCSVACPDDIHAQADTTVSGQDGTIVHFSPPSGNEDCGTVVVDHCNDCFFPVGVTTVTATAPTGESCSFTVTVNAINSGNATVACPSNQSANADNNCEAVVNVGNATATGTNVTVTGARSDGKPMYDCDVNGWNCVRKAQDLPFAAGTNTVTWTAYAHDVPGPYASQEEEEAHRSGSASCTQTITINDVTPPTINAPPQTASADANCQAPIPDYSDTALDNCACSSSDDSESCQGRERIVVNQSMAAGTLVGPGTYTITLSANDGSSNNGGAGNTTTTTTTFTVADTTAPTVTAPADSSASADASCQAPVPNYVAGSTAADNCDSSLTLTQSPAAGTMVGNGPHTVTVTATDDAGNSGSDTVIFTVNDTTPPTITAPADSSASADANCQAPVPNYVAGTTTADNCDSSLAITQSPAAGTMVGKGSHTVTVTATDDAGNSSSDTVIFTVNDTTPPVITCQVDIVVDFDPAVNGAVVTYTPPVGSDNCSGATTAQIAGLPSGATFPVGTTTNTFRVTDASGNTAQCSFKVTVALTSIIGLDSVTITGAAYIDSYSSAGGYPATKGSLAKLLSNGTITMGNSAKVWGDVRSTRAGINMTGASQITGNATAGTTVTTSGSASVGGTRTNNAMGPVMTLPSVPTCGPPYSSNSGISGNYSYNASTGDLTLSGVNIATLANGNYCFHNVTVGNSSQLKVNGPVVIKLTGTLSTTGATSLNNTTQIPSNLRILSSYTGSTGLVLGNSSSIYSVIYGPNTGLNISGAGPLFGTAAAKTITLGGSGAIHYDTQLKTIWPDLWTLIVGP